MPLCTPGLMSLGGHNGPRNMSPGGHSGTNDPQDMRPGGHSGMSDPSGAVP